MGRRRYILKEALNVVKGEKVMKINSAVGNESALNNGYIQNRMEGGAKAGEAVKVENGSINASGLSIFEDEIANKKQKAMQDAMQYIKEQFAADGEIGDTLESCRKRSAESRESLKEAQKEIAAIEEEKQRLKEEYGEDSEEYKLQAEEYDKMKEPWQQQKEAAQKDIALQAGTIRGIKQEILKHHGMIDAQNAKELTLEAAGKEIAGMLIEEAREKIEEDIKDAVEKGEEQKAEKEEIESKLEEIQAEQKKKAQDAEEDSKENHNNAKRSTGAPDLDAMNQKFKEIAENTQKIAAEQKLLMEEMKGIAVDTVL